VLPFNGCSCKEAPTVCDHAAEEPTTAYHAATSAAAAATTTMVIPPTDPRVSYSNGRFYHHSTAAREHPSHYTAVTAAVTPDAASRGKVPVRWSWTGFGSFPQYR